MSPDSRKTRRLAGVFFLGWVLLNYPLLTLFNLPTSFAGIPLLYGYVFAAWALIIGLCAAITGRSRPPGGTDE
jgi:hypothetical protein